MMQTHTVTIQITNVAQRGTGVAWWLPYKCVEPWEQGFDLADHTVLLGFDDLGRC